MDRIYYFRLTKENADQSVNKIKLDFPIFRKEVGSYEIYYLQVNEACEKRNLSAVKAGMEKGIRRLSSWYREEDEVAAWLVYEPSFEMWLKDRHVDEYWQTLWGLSLYSEYRESHNLQLLLAQIPKDCLPRQLLILGEAPGMREWVDMLARYMKSITCFSLSEPRGFDAVREKLLGDYGLLIRWEKSLHLKSNDPALVLDYCDKDKVFLWDVAPGSIWLDMNSRECHRHSVEDRDTGIGYISLKCFWREEMLQTLDTANKIQYNTKVN